MEAPKTKPTMEECFAVLEAMKKTRPASYALLAVKMGTGQRFCHASALKWGDVDFKNGIIRFGRKQVRGVVGPVSKKKPVPRELPMLPLADRDAAPAQGAHVASRLRGLA